MAYNPSSLTAGMSVKYCTPTDDDPAFIFAYPAGQTLTELSPAGIVCQPGTLAVAPTTW